MKADSSPAIKAFLTSVNQTITPTETSEKCEPNLQLEREYASTNAIPDVEELFKKLDGLPVDIDDESGWHEVVFDLLDACDQGAEVPKEALLFIYNNSLCSCCRSNAVAAMGKRGWLTDDIIRECEFDSYEDTRDYIKRIKNK